MRIILISLFLLISEISHSQSYDNNILSELNVENYSSQIVRTNNEFSIYVFPHNAKKNRIHTNCLLYTNAPRQGFDIIKNNLEKYGINTFLYSDLFSESKVYSNIEIQKKFELNKIDLILKIGYNSDYYNSGFKTVGAGPFPNGRSNTKQLHGKSVKFYYDFYDLQWDSIAFLKSVSIGFTNRNELKLYNELSEILFRYIFKTNLMIYQGSKEMPSYFFNMRLNGVLRIKPINNNSNFEVKAYGNSQSLNNEISSGLKLKGYSTDKTHSTDYILYYYYGELQLKGINKKGLLIKITDKNDNEICSYKELKDNQTIETLLEDFFGKL